MMVLIFDDDVAAQPHEYVFPQGLAVRLFDRADECIGLVTALKPDIVFMDYHMRSGYKGESAVRDLRRVFAVGELTIVGISSSEALNERMRAAGADRTVQKRQLQELLFECAAQETAARARRAEAARGGGES